ncbi:MAG TPA: nuclear transport factor 2 family protein [Pirellulales bacterium]|nr:nuclear transport factor 2 family protein [Pirellulales bacterium]
MTVIDATCLADIEEIKQLKFRYGMLVDALPARGRDAANELAVLFTEPMHVDFRSVFGVTLTSKEEFSQFFGETLPASLGWMLHSFSNPIIEVAGNHASGTWLLYAMTTARDNPHSAPDISYGRYLDEYVRTPDGWRQRSLKYKNLTRNGAPAGATEP